MKTLLRQQPSFEAVTALPKVGDHFHWGGLEGVITSIHKLKNLEEENLDVAYNYYGVSVTLFGGEERITVYKAIKKNY